MANRRINVTAELQPPASVPASTRRRWSFRRRFVLPAVLLALAWGSIYAYGAFHLPIGSGPAGPAVSVESFKRPWSQRRVLLLGLGDSVTAGFGADTEHSYIGRLARNPGDEWPDMQGRCLAAVFPNLQVRNAAVSGSNSDFCLNNEVRRLATQPDDVFGVVAITTGGNDLIHAYGRCPPREGAMYGATMDQARPWVVAFQGRLIAILDEVKAKFPGGCEVFLADIYDPTDGGGVPWYGPYPAWPDAMAILTAYNAAIREVAGSHANVHLVPLHDAFLGHGFRCSKFWTGCYRRNDPTFWYAPILEDPNERGFDAARRVFLLEMVKVLADSPELR